jgi:hypothetical protein
MEAMMSESGKGAGSERKDARKQAEMVDPTERKMSGLLGMDEQEDETSQEAPNNPPQDESAKQHDQPG